MVDTIKIVRVRTFLFCALFGLGSVPAVAFDVDGFRSGMSQTELVAVAKSRGLDVNGNSSGSWGIGKFDKYQIDGTFAFCGDAMRSYNRSIDFDTDYIPALHSLSEKYGEPATVLTTQQPWSGPGGGYIRSVEMTWRYRGDKIVLSFSPEERGGAGQLKHYRSASVNYDDERICDSRAK